MATMDSEAVKVRGEEYRAEGGEDEVPTKIEEANLRYDSRGMLLIPQPTDRPDDPLVRYLSPLFAHRLIAELGEISQVMILLVLSFLAMLGGMGASLIVLPWYTRNLIKRTPRLSPKLHSLGSLSLKRLTLPPSSSSQPVSHLFSLRQSQTSTVVVPSISY